MSDVMTKIPEDHPVIIAWREHQTTDDFANSYKWAAHPKHLQGSLWGVFLAGWMAAKKDAASRDT